MEPKDLAVCLNVSQGQMHRYIREAAHNGIAAIPAYIPVPYDVLVTWAREMRDAEAALHHLKGN